MIVALPSIISFMISWCDAFLNSKQFQARFRTTNFQIAHRIKTSFFQNAHVPKFHRMSTSQNKHVAKMCTYFFVI